MLTIHYGRESLNKEKFMFEKIGETQGKTILLVPDQFTLQAEKEAFHYLNTNGLMDLEVLSLSRLGARILSETGGSQKTPVDENGRYMLIAKIIAKHKDKLRLYKSGMNTPSFIQLANDLIYEMKQYNTASHDLSDIIQTIEEDSILKQKLADILIIYQEYEEYMKEKYLDGEDYIALFTSMMERSQLVAGSHIWIYGFDYFTPKNIQVLSSLMTYSKELHIMLTFDEEAARDAELFELAGGVIAQLRQIAENNGIGFAMCPAPISYAIARREKEESLLTLEQELFSTPVKSCRPPQEGITLVKAANPYSEIESAAAYILELIRDYGLRLNDIAIICNDMDVRAQVAKRIFSEYGIELFIDKKRNFTSNPMVRFIVSLLSIASEGYRNADLFCLLKTGLTDVSTDQCEQLENYAYQYKIKGGKWKSAFLKGQEEHGETLIKIEETRKELIHFISEFEKPYQKARTVREKTEALCNFLIDTAKIPDKLEQLTGKQIEDGFYELAEGTTQAWAILVNLFDQLVKLIGEEDLPAAGFTDVLRAGLESVEVGLLPPTADGLIVGSMQRIRVGRIKALLVIGANDGILPSAMAREGLLSDDEKSWLLSQGIEICRGEELRAREERVAIYRNLSKPQRFLWMSYSISDTEGNKQNPSQIFEKVREIFPRLKPQADVLSSKTPIQLMQAKDSSLLHLTNALRNSMDYETFPEEEWMAVMDWHKEKNAAWYEMLVSGLLYNNHKKHMEKNVINGLYKKGDFSVVLSPSRLEKYGKCPFSHFVSYGIRPDEMRVYEIAGREIGDLYHNCLMRFSMELTEPDREVTDADSKWMTITKEACDELIGRIIEEEAGRYKEGMLNQGNEEMYRTQRIKSVCAETAWTLIEHVRSGNIKAIDFELRFGRLRDSDKKHDLGRRTLPPVEVQLRDGQRVLIEGKIDRIDVLGDGSVKVIDYKSGIERFDVREAKAGWRLQLMLYLKAALQEHAHPAGIFYFLIDEQSENGRMDGIVVNKVSVIDNIAGDFQKYSNIIPIQKLADGRIKGNSENNLMSEEVFEEFRQAVDEKIRQLCSELIDGCVDARPKRSGSISACTYCSYKSICFFDLEFEGCRYENV